MNGITRLVHISCMTDYSKKMAEAFEEQTQTRVTYDYFSGTIAIGSEKYEVGSMSFSEIAETVLGTLKELYGEYHIVPRSFNSETYENELFSADVLALGSQGMLEFTVYRKGVV